MGSYSDYTDCDVVPMEACSLLLGRPWQYDIDCLHHGRTNHYSLLFKGKKIILHPMTLEQIVKDDIARATKALKQCQQQPATSKEIKLHAPVLLATHADFDELHVDNMPCYALGIEVDSSKIDAIQSWPMPTTVTQIQSFLGLAGFYRRFMRDFSSIATLLHELTKKGVPFSWDAAQDEAFTILKDKLTHAPLLQLPDFNKIYTMLSQLDFKIFGLQTVKEQYADDPGFQDIMLHCKDDKPWGKFHVVYGYIPQAPIDLLSFDPLDAPHVDAIARVQQMLDIHEQTQQNIAHTNAKNQAVGSKGRKLVTFEPGDLVWLYLRKDRFPSLRRSKLMPRAAGPFKVLKKINDNAYILDLPADYGVSSSFNVVDLKPYVGEAEELPSRTTSIQEGEDDEDINTDTGMATPTEPA
ncbi:uncharacterized protein [Miscanthus floridulus]|uniref:uncharacterized protein n=1 Tax=Miscanthus floridulus TaxID=154761 RepID=UPI0034582B7D